MTHNEAIRRLDALVQLAVSGRELSAPPEAPEEGDCWLVPASATGDWAGQADAVAAWQDGAWAFIASQTGWRVWVVNEAALLVWTGTGWEDAVPAPDQLQNMTRLGVGTTADATNPFAAKLNKALWTAKYDDEGGDGDLRYTLNKEAPGKTLSLLMQTDWSGRAEIGLTGDDDLRMKVSADGAAWKDALVADRSTGAVSFPQGQAHALSGLALNDLVFTSGGDGTISIWRVNATHAQSPHSATIAAITGDTITLTAPDAGQFGAWTGYMAGVSLVRIWNMSRDPVESAWIKDSPSSSELTVHDVTDLAAWTAGDTIQIGDPETTTQVAGIRAGDGAVLITSTEPSPISDSNLVFVVETFDMTAGIELISCMGVFV